MERNADPRADVDRLVDFRRYGDGESDVDEFFAVELERSLFSRRSCRRLFGFDLGYGNGVVDVESVDR